MDSESQELLDLWDSLSKADKAAIKYEMYLRAGQVRPVGEGPSARSATGKVG